MESHIETCAPVLASESLTMQRNDRHANLWFHLLGYAINILTCDSRSTCHCYKDSLRIIAFLGNTNCVTQLGTTTKHHILL